MSKAKIEDLGINFKKKLTPTEKRSFEKILIDEFNNQTTVLNADIESATEAVMVAYRKEIGFKKIKDEVNKAQDVLNRKRDMLKEAGLTIDGRLLHVYSPPGQPMRELSAVKKIKDRIDAATVALREPRNVKNKILARIWMSDTVGEALVIMNEVLGNGILPSVDKKELLAIEAPKA